MNQAFTPPSLPPSLPQVLLVERLYMRREMYLSIMMDRSTQGPVIVASPVGGTSIEDVAASNPEKIFTEAIDIMEGLTEETAIGIATKIGTYLPFLLPSLALVGEDVCVAASSNPEKIFHGSDWYHGGADGGVCSW